MNRRVREWIRRYLPAEVCSLAITILAVLITYAFSGNRLTTAILGTWFGNIGYFGYLLVADVIYAKKVIANADRRYTLATFFKNIRALFAEFGIAELFDSFLIRPALLYYLPLLLGNLTMGSIVAKFAADITFYFPAIISYELTKARFRKFDE
jgi:hypothetical protein